MALTVYLGRNGNWSDVSNWSLGAIPVLADDVVIPDTTQTALTTNLDRTGDNAGAGLDLNSLFIHEGHYGNIGSVGNPLRCTVDNAVATEPSILHRGTGELWYNAETGGPVRTTGTVVINARNTERAAIIDGDRVITALSCVGGHTIIAAGYAQAFPRIFLADNGAGTAPTITMPLSGVGGSALYMTGGVCNCSRPMTAVYVLGGMMTYGDGIITGMYQTSGLCIFNSGDALNRLILFGGTFDTTRTAVAKTITDLYEWPGATLLRSAQLTVTNEYNMFDDEG